MTTKEDTIKIRRGKVADLLSKGYSQAEISRELRCSEPTVSRDVEELRQQAIKNVEGHIEGLPLAWETAKTSLEYLIFKAHEILESKGLEVDQRLAAIKIISELSKARLDLHSAPVRLRQVIRVQQRLKEKIESLQRTQKANYEVISEVHAEAGKPTVVRRRLARTAPKKEVEEQPIV